MTPCRTELLGPYVSQTERSKSGPCWFNSTIILGLRVNGLEAGVIRSEGLGGTSLQEKNIKRLTPGMGAFNMMDNNNGLKVIITSHTVGNRGVTKQKHWIGSLFY